jgi:predicted DNA-binding protein (UPF0251 family)/DNA-directed RNA polymerase subunit RPC12/RpoP
MPRKRCCGRVDDYPVSRQFISPLGGPPVTLGVEEAEALRLKDMLGYGQERCAQQMSLTRPTFQRVLASARKKVAMALAEGRSIIIEGGHFIMGNRAFECLDCGEKWEVGPCGEDGRHGYEIPCPKCGSLKKVRITDGERHTCGGPHSHGAGCGCQHGHQS